MRRAMGGLVLCPPSEARTSFPRMPFPASSGMGWASGELWVSLGRQIFLPRESRGQRSLVGCCPRGRTESDTTEVT